MKRHVVSCCKELPSLLLCYKGGKSDNMQHEIARFIDCCKLGCKCLCSDYDDAEDPKKIFS